MNDTEDIDKMNDTEDIDIVLQTENSKKTLPKLNNASFTYDNKTITVTHDMTLHINIPDGINLQNTLSSDDDTYLLELTHIIFTKLISNIPDTLTFKLYIFHIPSSNISDDFTRDAFEILKPLIFDNKKTMYTYERYFVSRYIDEYTDDNKE